MIFPNWIKISMLKRNEMNCKNFEKIKEIKREENLYKKLPLLIRE